MLDPLTIALAIYGGYQGYKSAKKAGASGPGRILGAAIGAYGGYNLGTGIGSLTSAAPNLAIEGGTQAGLSALTNQGGIAALQNVGTDVATDALTQAAIEGGTQAGIGSFNPYAGMTDQFAGTSLGFTPLDTLSTTPLSMQDFSGTTLGNTPVNLETPTPPPPPLKEESFLQKAKTAGGDAYSYLFEKTDPKTGKQVLDVGKAALIGLPALSYASGAFEREPYERSMFTYNLGYPELYRNRKFYTQDPKTGEVKELPQQQYIPEESEAASVTKTGDRFGPYKRETITLQQGGLATLNHFKDGGVNYLPSKTIHDEDDEDNYIRTNGYVEDGAGNGDKEEDTMLAQLADGEFVTRTDGVLGAGILAGANPKNAKEMRKLGAEFFYEQQKRFKRIYDLLDASRKATAH
jgi:hypothetical protein